MLKKERLGEAIRITFTTGASTSHAEDLIRELGSEPIPRSAYIVDLSGLQHLDPGVGWRLGNALRRHAQAGLVEVVVPAVSRDDQAFSGKWFQVFTRTGLGAAIGKHARTVRDDRGEVAGRISKYYSEALREYSQNFVFLPDVHLGRSVNVNDFDDFSNRFAKWLRHATSCILTDDRLHPLQHLCFEAIQNAYDHAHRAPHPKDSAVLSYFSIAYRRVLSPPAVDLGDFRGYLMRLRQSLEPTNAECHFLELTINDDGVGFAAREAQDPEVYWKESSLEREALQEALRFGGSVKLKTSDAPVRGDPGFGTSQIDQSLRDLRAYALMRTGRVQAFFDATRHDSGGFKIDPVDLGYMPGTTLDIIVPVLERQLRLALSRS